MLQKISVSNKSCSFELFNDQKYWKMSQFQKVCSTTVFNIDNTNKMFLEHQITMLWFLTDHVIKIEVMAAENSALPSQEYITCRVKIY